MAISTTEFLWENVDKRIPDAQQLARDAVKQHSLEDTIILAGEIKAHAQSLDPALAPFETDRARRGPVSKHRRTVITVRCAREHRASASRRNQITRPVSSTDKSRVINVVTHRRHRTLPTPLSVECVMLRIEVQTV